jgi:predicted nucleic-acid-binding protein
MVVDSDVVIRFLTNDDPQKADRFKEFLQTGNKIILTNITVAEIIWTLKSFYKLDKTEIIPLIRSLINHSSIQCQQTLLKQSIHFYRNFNLSWIDAYTAAYSIIRNDQQVLSFDKGFDKLSDIKRQEP